MDRKIPRDDIPWASVWLPILLAVEFIVGCAGPLIRGGEIHIGRTIALTFTTDVEPLGDAIPAKQAHLYRGVVYVVVGNCDVDPGRVGAAASDRGASCRVRVADLGILALASPDRFYKLDYRGWIFSSGLLSVEFNDNSTLHSLRVTEEPAGPDLYLNFGPLGPGVR